MGVFARLLRRSKATEEASTAEPQAGTQTVEPAAEAAEAKGLAETEVPTGAETDPTAEAPESVETASAEDVEIPKQQSAEDAADTEAGKGACT